MVGGNRLAHLKDAIVITIGVANCMYVACDGSGREPKDTTVGGKEEDKDERRGVR
jgi:hypothetical protein